MAVWRCVVRFFFQAEDGIRDLTVTGVQTCALPICSLVGNIGAVGDVDYIAWPRSIDSIDRMLVGVRPVWICPWTANSTGRRVLIDRSEEHTSELQSQSNLVCRLLLEKKKHTQYLRR